MKSEVTTAAAMPDVEASIEAPSISREAPVTSELEEQERRALEATWKEPPGFRGWLTSTNHKSIGRRYLITAFIFFPTSGILAVLMRIQLSRPENNFLGPDLYNQIFMMHGTTMMFLFAIPVMEALAPVCGGFIGWRNWGRAGRKWPDESEDNIVSNRFMATIGLMISVLCSLIIIEESRW